ncbi:uncharacterized protein [Parasteatoda tepidariorum]|uniref:uncharacterized protein isoform X1 n=1 Tax=Parasteatoda tepidariorum TaxID=114398 RepID=UPI001C719D5A|nr:uncharacterized protein LOC107443707 isoform X1 [Parasteatoda tepidariorum]XP_015913146.2 uncharacterized protein LOC107443707 isoform X1 [Parasteatoda tepidariorum]
MGKFCFCPGCKTGYPSELKKRKDKQLPTISLFKAPKDPAVFEIWRRSIPRADRQLRNADHICSRHFKKDDIERFYETKLPDGTIFRLKRERPRLKLGAIPCLFPDIPGHSSYRPKEFRSPKIRKKKLKKTRLTKTVSPSSLPPPKQQISGKLETSLSEEETKQKKESSIQLGKENILFEGIVFHPIAQNLPVQHTTMLLKERENAENEMNFTPLQNCSINEPESSSTVDDLEKEHSIPSLCEVILNESNVIIPKSVVEEKFSFNFLKINVNMINTLNSWWKVNVLDDFISFIRWMPDYTVEKKIVITKDLAVKVFLKDRETAIGRNLKILSVCVISKLIFRVERTQICRCIHKKERNCDGFLQGVSQCKKHNLCLGCIKWEREQKKLLMKPVKLPSNLVELIRFNMNE